MKKSLLQALTSTVEDVSFETYRKLVGGLGFSDVIPTSKDDTSLDDSMYMLPPRWGGVFRDVYISKSFLKKHPGLPGSSDESRYIAATSSFLESEYQCWAYDRSCSESRLTREVISRARIKIGRLLSGVAITPMSIVLAGDHGPGATFDVKRRRGDGYYKMGNKPTATIGAARYPWMLCDLWADYVGSEVTLVRGSRFGTVPKTAWTDRGICTEPTLNMFLQKGLGKILRFCLRRWNIELRHLQSRNRDVARTSSVTGEYATVDLERASDTVSLELCRVLLPDHVFRTILDIRSPEVLFEGQWRDLWKVSSMGNGFTFELESLIFSGLALALCDVKGIPPGHTCSYGDDIVIPAGLYSDLVTVLTECGLSVNNSKSFAEGSFRESCGGHYFAGRDVTPIYIKKELKSPLECIWLANSIRRWAHGGFSCDIRLKDAYDYVVSNIPDCLSKPASPLWNNEGDPLDISLGGAFDECCPQFSADSQHFVATGWGRGSASRRVGGIPLLSKLLWSMDQRDSEASTSRGSDCIDNPEKVRHYPIRYAIHRTWPEVGPWM